MPAGSFTAQGNRVRGVCVRGGENGGERGGVGVRRVMRDKRIFSGLPQRGVGGVWSLGGGG